METAAHPMRVDVDYDTAWEDVQTTFGLDGRQMTAKEELPAQTAAFLAEEDLTMGILDYLQAEVEFRLRNDVVPAFWAHFKKPKSPETFAKAVTDLYVRVSHLIPFVDRMDILSRNSGIKVAEFGQNSYMSLFKLLLKATLHSQLPPDFSGPVEAFYSQAFHSFDTRQDNKELGLDDSSCSNQSECCEGCQMLEGCQCNQILTTFHDINKKLDEMDILDRLTNDIITKIVRSKITTHVNDSCQGSFTVSHLKPLEDWLDNVVMKWVRILYPASPTTGLDFLTSFRQRLCHYLYETYTLTRIDQLFNIIIEFPESQPALEDIRECLLRTDLRTKLTLSLKQVLEKKLLHLGVNTADILTAYVAAIRALRVLDSSGVLLELVCEPVRKYLRTRDDTVRCIVSSLIDDNSSELAEELTKNEGLCLDESIFNDVGVGDEDPEELEANWEQWQPDPIDASGNTRRRRSSDIISMLVNIYGSKELFVNEYRSLLSNRLLSQFSYETEKEIRNLELLKLRFGETPLHQCEVMLKDVSDSKRINTGLHNENDSKLSQLGFPVNALILSAQFWPQFKSETIQLPKQVQDSLDCYTKAFEAMKGNRTLAWKHHLGFANIDLAMGDKKINLTVSPVHAAIIFQFTEQSEWQADDLAASLKMPVTSLRRKITFWQAQGLLKETNNKYSLIEESPMRRMSGGGGETNEDEESITRTSSDQRAEELQVFWSYIVNMLINLESLPLERIFQMLKMFAMVHSQGPSAVECKIDALRAFLDEKVRQHELVFTGGQYKLPKN